MQLTGSSAAYAWPYPPLHSAEEKTGWGGGEVRLRVGFNVNGRQNTKIIHDITRARIGCVRSICSDLRSVLSAEVYTKRVN